MSPPDAAITELPASPGARLKREREARGLTEQQAAETLTLDPSVVHALEANEFGILGAPVFVKGHLRRYATMLGLPDGEILAAYERSKQHMAEPSLVPKSRLEMMPVRGRPKWPWVIGGTIAFLVAALLAAYISENGLPFVNRADDAAAANSLSGNDSAGGPGTNAGLATSPPMAQAAPSAGTSAQGTGSATDGSNAGPPAFSSGTAAPAAGTAARVDAGPAGAATTGTAPATQGPAVIAPGQVQLQLRFKGDSWVEVFDGSGRAVLYDLGKGGTERTLTAVAPLSVTIGNAASVAITINGQRVVAPRQGGGVMARFSVAPDGSLR